MTLLGKQKKLDANNDGKISGEDFKMLREKKIFGGLLKLSSAGARKAGKLLLDDATKDVKKISKDLPKDQSFKDATGTGSSKEDILSQQAAAMARPVGSFRDVSQVRENKYHIETLEDFFSGEPKLEKAIKQLKKQIYSKVKDKDMIINLGTGSQVVYKDNRHSFIPSGRALLVFDLLDLLSV